MINISFHQKNDEHILNNFINKMANWQSIQSLRIKMKFTPSGVYQSLITKTFRIRVFLFVQSLSLDATEESNEMNLLFNPIDGKINDASFLLVTCCVSN